MLLMSLDYMLGLLHENKTKYKYTSLVCNDKIIDHGDIMEKK
jgi:hypothetical protein